MPYRHLGKNKVTVILIQFTPPDFPRSGYIFEQTLKIRQQLNDN
jgi:hypothetical protein